MTAITDYATLVAEVKAWSARSDSTFSARFPVFVALAESRIYYGHGDVGDPLYSPPLRSKIQETSDTLTVTAGSGTLDDDVLMVRKLSRSGEDVGLSYVPPHLWATTNANATAGDPLFYTVENRTVRLTPSYTGTLDLLTVVRFSPVTAGNPTGPLIVEHGMLYFNAVMFEAMSFLREIDLAAAWLARYRSMVAGLNRAGAELRTSVRMRSVARPIGA